MKQLKWIIIAFVVLLIIWLTRLLITETTVKIPLIPNLAPKEESDLINDQESADVSEGFDSGSFTIANEQLTSNNERYPWSKEMPILTDHFAIAFLGEGKLEIILYSQNEAEFEQYRAEALNRLRATGAPADTLDINIRYQGQP